MSSNNTKKKIKRLHTRKYVFIPPSSYNLHKIFKKKNIKTKEQKHYFYKKYEKHF